MPGVEKSSGFLDRETYFLAKEWLLKTYRRPAHIFNRRTFKK